MLMHLDNISQRKNATIQLTSIYAKRTATTPKVKTGHLEDTSILLVLFTIIVEKIMLPLPINFTWPGARQSIIQYTMSILHRLCHEYAIKPVAWSEVTRLVSVPGDPMHENHPKPGHGQKIAFEARI